ncbi:hypothetical protein [Flavobacterium sp. C4GT6]|uniref:hypothetical protein n=1 Tax=Flavobacterium sp. C4GT6 TaxID=3103818 RepID=UPI002ED0BC4D
MIKTKMFFLENLENENIPKELIDELNTQLASGVKNDDNISLVEFKVHQRISDIESQQKFNFGPFVNANSNIDTMHTSYVASIMSDNYQRVTDGEGEVIILRRFGIGFELTLKAKEVKTKINANYGILAAAASMNLSEVFYKITVYGILTPELAQHLPSREGKFTTEIFEKIQNFFNEAKMHINNMPTTTLFPIEVLKNKQIVPDKLNSRAIYYASVCVMKGLPLADCITSDTVKKLKFDSDVLQFIYRYFDIENAYLAPTESQKDAAKKWIAGSFNKVKKTPYDGSWVEIDSAFVSNLPEDSPYKPHPMNDWATRPKALDEENFDISSEYSSELKLAGISNTSGKFNSYLFGRRIGFFTYVNNTDGSGNKVLETRYAVGINVLVKITGVEFGTNVNYASVGALAELNLGKVEYEISGIGINDKSLIDILPVPQDINATTFKELNLIIENLKYMIGNIDPDKFSPRPVSIRVKEAEKVDPTLYAQTAIYTYDHIRNREPYELTVAKVKELGLMEEVVTEIYDDLDIKDNEKPTRSDKLEAQDWLNFE